MSTNVTGYAQRYNLPLNDSLLAAFNDAWHNFEKKHGRQPEPDIMSFRGGFSTTTVVFEIVEEP